jgi:hypothetical protein
LCCLHHWSFNWNSHNTIHQEKGQFKIVRGVSLENEGKKKNRFDKLFNMMIVLVLIFLTYQWNTAHTKVKNYEKSNALEINYQLNELHDTFHSIEETLSKYEFPIQDDVRMYYQDAMDIDIQRIYHIGHTIEQINEYSNFRGINKNYISKIEEIMKGLRGFHYTQKEMDIATEALSEVQRELYSLIKNRDISLENEATREKVLTILDQFIEDLSVLEKY